MSEYTSYKRQLPYAYAVGVFPCLELAQKRPQSILEIVIDPDGMRNVGVMKLIDFAAQQGIPLRKQAAFIHRIAKKENAYAMAVFEKIEQTLNPQKNHLLLHEISDAGNLGTILRTAAAFEFDDIAIISPAVDVYDPKVVRASMGALFGLRVQYFEAFSVYQDTYQNRTLLPFMLQGSITPWQAAQKAGLPVTLLFGNEGAGLPESFAHLGYPVRIPQSAAVDSLNLAVAVGIGMSAFYR